MIPSHENKRRPTIQHRRSKSKTRNEGSINSCICQRSKGLETLEQRSRIPPTKQHPTPIWKNLSKQRRSRLHPNKSDIHRPQPDFAGVIEQTLKQLACSFQSVVCPTQDRSHDFLPDLPPIERTKTRSNGSPGGSEYTADAITRVSLGYPSSLDMSSRGREISNGCSENARSEGILYVSPR